MVKKKVGRPLAKPASQASCLYLLSALLPENQKEEGVIKLIEEAPATIKKVEDLGVRSLAYRIKKQTAARLVSIFFTAEPAAIPPLLRQLRQEEIIIRHLLTTWNDEIERPLTTARLAKESSSVDQG